MPNRCTLYESLKSKILEKNVESKISYCSNDYNLIVQKQKYRELKKSVNCKRRCKSHCYILISLNTIK